MKKTFSCSHKGCNRVSNVFEAINDLDDGWRWCSTSLIKWALCPVHGHLAGKGEYEYRFPTRDHIEHQPEY